MEILDKSPGEHFEARHLALGLVAILLFSGCFRLLVLDRPFEYDPEAYGSAYGVMARNYFNYAWTETHGMPVLTMGRNPDAPVFFYRDHPPLVPLLIFGVYHFFGVGEWQTRLPTAAFTVLTAFALYLLLCRHGSPRLGVIAAAVYAALPINLYYGGLAEVVGQPLVLFTVLSVLAYLNFHRDPSSRNLVLVITVFALAGASDWPAFIIVPVYLVHFLLTRPRGQWPRIFVFCLAACALFTALYIYIAVATHARWDWMIPVFLGRSGFGKLEFTAGSWLKQALEFNLSMHTLPVLIASGAWIILRGWRLRAASRPGTTVTLILLSWGLLHVAIGREGVYLHEWWWSPLAPGLAAATSLGLDAMISVLNRWGQKQHIGEVAVVCFLVLFTSWTSQASYRRLFPPKGSAHVSTRELGQAIQIAAPGPNDVALLVWSGQNPQEFFYGNRPLRDGVWSVEDFKTMLNGDKVVLVYGFEQPWKARAAGIVFPFELRSDYPELLRHLEDNYQQLTTPESLVGKFLVFNLQAPPAGRNIR